MEDKELFHYMINMVAADDHSISNHGIDLDLDNSGLSTGKINNSNQTRTESGSEKPQP